MKFNLQKVSKSFINEKGGKSFTFRIFIVALVLRLIPVILARGMGIGLDDMFQYDMLARSLAQGNGFRWYAEVDLRQLASFVDFDLTSVKDYDPRFGILTSFRAPLYPTFLAIVYFFNGTGESRFFAARIAQALFLGAPLAPLTYLVSKRLFSPLLEGEGAVVRSERAAKISAWIVAAYPMLLVYPLGLGTENPFFLLLLVSFYFLLLSKDQPTTLNFILSGLFLGLTALTRSVILLFAGLAILWIWFVLKQKRGAILVAVMFALTIMPWVIRNSLLHHKLTGIETSMGYNLHLGYHPQGNGSFVFGPSLELLPILNDAERDRIGTEQAVEFIKAQPKRFIPLAINRLSFFWGLEKRVLMYFYSNNIFGFIPQPWLLIIVAVLLLPFVFISVGAALGLSFISWEPQHILRLLLLIGYLLPHVFILSEDRFHLAIIPFFSILAAQFWVHGFQGMAARWQESRQAKFFILFGIVIAFLLIFNWGWELTRDWDKIAQLLGPNGNQAYFSY